MEDIVFSGSHFLQQKLFVLVETAFFPFSGSHFFQSKHQRKLLEEIIGLQWKQLLLVKTAPFNRWHFFYEKLFLSLEAIHFSGSHRFQFFSARFLVEIHCTQLKPILLEEACSFQWKHGRNCSFSSSQWKPFLLVLCNIFTSRSYQKLHE